MQTSAIAEFRQDLGDESRQFELLVNSVTDYAIYMLDLNGYIRTWNPGGERIKGYAPVEVLGTHFSRFYTPEDVGAGIPAKNLETAASQGRYVDEGWRLRKDGTRFRASVMIDPILVDGKLIGFAKVTRDITERYQTEQRLQEAQQTLLQAQKLEAVGRLTLGLAHDFNNLLTIVVNCLDVIRAKVGDDKINQIVDTALRASERGVLLTRQLLTFGRGQSLAPECIDVNALIAEAEELLRRSAGNATQMTFDLADALPTVDVDKTQFEAAVLNLICNSRDAMPNGGAISITTCSRRMRDPSSPEGPEKPYVCIEVKDTGEGIPYENQPRVFEPFFTTKEVGRGSGLGLSQVFGFAAQSGGFAHLDSTPNQGTAVSICLPATEGTP